MSAVQRWALFTLPFFSHRACTAAWGLEPVVAIVARELMHAQPGLRRAAATEQARVQLVQDTPAASAVATLGLALAAVDAWLIFFAAAH